MPLANNFSNLLSFGRHSFRGNLRPTMEKLRNFTMFLLRCRKTLEVKGRKVKL
jgi:hypothetical protein